MSKKKKASKPRFEDEPDGYPGVPAPDVSVDVHVPHPIDEVIANLERIAGEGLNAAAAARAYARRLRRIKQ